MQNKYLKIGTMMYNIFIKCNENKYIIQKRGGRWNGSKL